MVRKIILDQPPIVSDAVNVPREAIGRIIGQCSVNWNRYFLFLGVNVVVSNLVVGFFFISFVCWY
jgi:hypothetical protein